MCADDRQIVMNACESAYFFQVYDFQIEHSRSSFATLQYCVQFRCAFCHGYPCHVRPKLVR